MSPEFLRALVDLLLPHESAPPKGSAPLPAGSAAGLELNDHAEVLGAVGRAVAGKAGSAETFLAATEARRMEILQSVQRDLPEDFARLLSALLANYYEAPEVLEALGWRSEPPQPLGHVVATMDEASAARLQRVKLGRKLWRGA
jgi:hypothetical protein